MLWVGMKPFGGFRYCAWYLDAVSLPMRFRMSSTAFSASVAQTTEE